MVPGGRRTHWTGLCNLKSENVSPNCRDIIVSMLWEMKFYFQLLCVHSEILGHEGHGLPRPLPVLRPCCYRGRSGLGHRRLARSRCLAKYCTKKINISWSDFNK